MTYGLLICAGNQTRFASNLPKALVKIDNEILLDKNIKNLKKVCNEVYIVVSNNNKQYFSRYPNLIAIDSGFGCGDAIYKALQKIPFLSTDNCIIQWGDSYIDEKTLLYSYDMYKTFNQEVLIPCKYESNPYVQLIPYENTIRVRFSKFKDEITAGYHDLSFFIGNIQKIYDASSLFRLKFFKNNSYKHIHGDEFSFLDLFNDTNLQGKILEIVDCKDYSFNTLEDLQKLGGKI